MLERLLEWIGPVFTDAGYVIIAIAIFLERSIFLGLLVPGDVVLATGGIFAARHNLDLSWVIGIGTAAGLAGESGGFWLGRRYGRRLIHRLPLVNRLEDKLEDAESFFDKHGGKTIAVGRFATAAGSFVPFTAGTARVSYGKFLAYDVPSVLVWAAGIALVGFFFGENVDTVDSILSRFGWGMLGLVVAFFVGRWLWMRRKKQREA